MSVAASAALPDDDSIRIRPLQPTIGAEIEGVDLSRPLAPAQRDAIRAAVLRHKVVFFRDQALDNESQAAFAAQFGALYTHPSTTRDPRVAPIHRIAAVDAAKYEKRLHRDVPPGDGYHSDTSWRLVPTWGAVLRAVTLPEVGGDTIWVDANLAYEGLSAELKERLEGLHVTHDFREALAASGHDYPIVAHPVVRAHRETGQKILWVNLTQKPQILGVELAESRALLDEVLRQYKRPEFQVRFSWRPGSVAFWDNRAAVHYAVRNYGDFPRHLERVLIADEPLYAGL
ncbi:taurine catabolism dioxygenase TauD [Rhizorhabdus wittichii DC-6]|uniref:TauD/TfdA family dioxygenase n=1 Tax=Rhizorhabdus wittichii TaxID=160791 RepID=A0A975HBY6_9SPHN|nr:TauD/TfdA family dioxygenase [Rhizorhabdus wittichii]ARR53595.1 taurine catabolism dioxygenase TauD [Rhizorhabdus wittichii DC-6]QTH19905.1 TauD/TfdA family dioxygenase [Rhizorhabdus wittichii]